MALTKLAVAQEQPPVTSIRLPTELREYLSQEARKQTRSLSAVIIQRLWASLRMPPTSEPEPAHPQGNAAATSDTEARLILLFRQMPPEQQLALLTLLKA